MKQGPSGVEHGAAGHADGRASSAGNVGLGEDRAVARELIQVRGLNRQAGKRAKRVKTLVVGEEEQDIRFGLNAVLSQPPRIELARKHIAGAQEVIQEQRLQAALDRGAERLAAQVPRFAGVSRKI
ncbi:MAG: hypothetical protein HYV35_02360, partial [Lentisphaerae bacterium]|nr:hypothetical protein [Lentisphaerota bacterium]